MGILFQAPRRRNLISKHMRSIRSNNALARPDAWERNSLERSIQDARRKVLPVRILIGIGECKAGIALRVLGYAKIITEAIRTDVPAIVNNIPLHIFIFSTGPKLAAIAGKKNLSEESSRGIVALTALAGAFRVAGMPWPITVELAAPHLEIEGRVRALVDLRGEVETGLRRLEENNQNNADGLIYGIEHGGHFQDVGYSSPSFLRIFIGGKPEGLFWVVRKRVRIAAAQCGMVVNPMLGIIVPSLRQPWYHTRPDEPLIRDLVIKSRKQITADLEALWKRNTSLKREATLTSKLLSQPIVDELPIITSNILRACAFFQSNNITVGDRAQQQIANSQDCL